MKAIVKKLPPYEIKAIEEREKLIEKIAGKNTAVQTVPPKPEENKTKNTELEASIRSLREELEKRNNEINQIARDRDDHIKEIKRIEGSCEKIKEEKEMLLKEKSEFHKVTKVYDY